MLRYALTYLAGAATVTVVCLTTGGMNVTFFALGAAAALAGVALVLRAIGAARLARLFGSLADQPAPRAAVARPVEAPAAASSVERDVVSALANLGIRRTVATAAVSAARAQAPQQFEPLFRASLDLVPCGRGKVAAA
jgi:hypothetical protein